MQRIDVLIGIAVFIVFAVLVSIMVSVFWPYAVMFVGGCILVVIVAVVQESFTRRRKH